MSDPREAAMSDSAATLRVRVQPRASRNEIAGWREGVLYIRLTAPPVEGAANRAVVEFIAGRLGLRRHQVALVSGERSRDKILEVEGLAQDELDARLGKP
jgi:uncharacterized protein